MRLHEKKMQTYLARTWDRDDLRGRQEEQRFWISGFKGTGDFRPPLQ